MKTNKIILSLIFVFIFIFSAFTFTACRVEGGGSSTEQTQTGGNQGGSGGGNTSGTTEGMSNIAKGLKDNSYYVSLVDECGEHNHHIEPTMYAAPYRFLREHGFDVDAYLNKELKIISTPFMYEDEPNNLYISVKAECPSNDFRGNYYHNYILKYSVSDKEREEYVELCDYEYLQGLLYIQELDNQRTPTIVSDNKIAIWTYDRIVKSDNNTNPSKYSSVDIDVLYTSVENSQLNYLVRKKATSMYMQTYIYNYELNLKTNAYDLYYDNNVFFAQNSSQATFANDYKKDYRVGYTFGIPQQVKLVKPFEDNIFN